MREIIIASKNAGKIREYQNAFKNMEVKLSSLIDLGYKGDIAETGKTFEENAFIKAKQLYKMYKKPVIADDSGLLVKSLPNELGVKSKRFSKSETDDDNIDLLLERIRKFSDRSAQFVTVICFYISDLDIRYFTGKTEGKIINHRCGKFGFGYDPVFLVKGYEKTYGELNLDEKHLLSHRGKAIDKLKRMLENENINF
ncbi:MAG: RdgB/HAM1 family non-canonical purine NTP pyrophosphatase [Candidatus Izemoplasmatales bacterium]|nr:RdgB/HAM1 family non-canonical purine NTP pyrophosphatase [Candidatus Izemoplasmatales bacterium]